jgi:hypothetical protein
VGWLRERDVLLPGVTTLARLVAQVRDDTTRRLWAVLEGLLTAGQRYVLDQLLEVPPGSRVSDLERWRRGPVPRGSGPAMIKALDQVAEVMGLGMAELGARKICHGRKGELYHRYERGLENQLGVLGLVLNCVVLWTTVYLDAAVRQLKAQGYPVRDEDMARLSPFVSRHLGVHGAYSFLLPDLAPGAIRDLRDPDTPDDDDDEA